MLTFNFANPNYAKLHDHIIGAARRSLPQAQHDSHRDRPGVVICGTGPTLDDPETLDEIRQLTFRGFDVWALKDAVRLLDRHDIIVSGTVAMDPGIEQLEKTPTVRGVTYFLASSCHPALFDHLLESGCEVVVFHSATGWKGEGTVPEGHPEAGRVVQLGETHLYKELFGNASCVVGGYTVANRAVGLAKFLGYPEVHLAGAPFGWRVGGECYATGAAGRLRDNAALVMVHTSPPWLSKPDLVASALHIAWAIRQGAVCYIGDGLPKTLAAMDEDELCRQFPDQWPGAKKAT